MSDSNQQRLEVMWGIPILDEGFTNIPNILIRNYRKLGIEHGEWGIICNLLSYKHDERDPYPSQEALAENLKCSIRQIQKWINSLRDKKLIRTGRRKSIHTKMWEKNVYNFKPLIDAALTLIGQVPMPEPAPDFDIVWDDEPEQEKSIDNRPVPEVQVGGEPEVHVRAVPEVRVDENNDEPSYIKVPIENDRYVPEVQIKNKSIKNKKDKIKSQSVSDSEIKSGSIQKAISKNKKLQDRLTDITFVYESVRDETGYSDALFIATIQKAIKAKIKVPFAQYLLQSMINNLREQHSVKTVDKPVHNDLPEWVTRQLSMDEIATTGEEVDEEKKREVNNLLRQLGEIN